MARKHKISEKRGQLAGILLIVSIVALGIFLQKNGDEVTELKSKINLLEDEVGSLQYENDELTSQLSYKTSQLLESEDKVAELEQDIEELEDDVSDLQCEVDGIQQFCADLDFVSMVCEKRWPMINNFEKYTECKESEMRSRGYGYVYDYYD